MAKALGLLVCVLRFIDEAKVFFAIVELTFEFNGQNMTLGSVRVRNLAMNWFSAQARQNPGSEETVVLELRRQLQQLSPNMKNHLLVVDEKGLRELFNNRVGLPTARCHLTAGALPGFKT